MGDMDAIYEQRLLASPRRPAAVADDADGYGGTPRSSRASPARTSPAPKRDVISDRFIPSRGGSNLQANFALLPDEQTRAARSARASTDADGGGKEDGGLDAYSLLLKSELLGCDGLVKENGDDKAGGPSSSPLQRNLFRFKSTRPARDENAPYSRSPVGADSQRLLASPRKATRARARARGRLSLIHI